MTIIGVSFDQPAANATFKANESFEFALWSDLDRELALTYGAASNVNQFFADRRSVLLDPNGDLVAVYPLPASGVGGLYAHAQHILDDCTILIP